MSKTSVFLITAEDEYGPLAHTYGVFLSHREAKAAIYQYCEELVEAHMWVSDRGGYYEKFEITKHKVGKMDSVMKIWTISPDEVLGRLENKK